MTNSPPAVELSPQPMIVPLSTSSSILSQKSTERTLPPPRLEKDAKPASVSLSIRSARFGLLTSICPWLVTFFQLPLPLTSSVHRADSDVDIQPSAILAFLAMSSVDVATL